MRAIPTMRRRCQAGYTLIMVIFLVATMIILAAAAAPVVLTQGRRQMEEEMVWRGEQYERAIRLFYIRLRRYPTKIEDLTNQTNGVRFLRQAYKNPMNREDGSWRFIYAGLNGQLIGSLRPASLLQTNLSGAGISGLSSLSGGPQPPPAGGTSGQQAGSATSNTQEPQPQSLTGAVIGGNITGVGGTNDDPSFRVYMGGDTYKKWEFIFNPTGLQPLTPPGTNQPGAPGVPNPTAPQPPQQNPQLPGSNSPGSPQ